MIKITTFAITCSLVVYVAHTSREALPLPSTPPCHSLLATDFGSALTLFCCHSSTLACAPARGRSPPSSSCHKSSGGGQVCRSTWAGRGGRETHLGRPARVLYLLKDGGHRLKKNGGEGGGAHGPVAGLGRAGLHGAHLIERQCGGGGGQKGQPASRSDGRSVRGQTIV